MTEISIVIPVYKIERYLSKCLDSILSQTFKDFEVICVNDGSPDGCGEILEKYAKKDSRIRVISQKNQGVSIARNNGLKKARGKYICFIDGDDEVAPEFLGNLYEILKKSKADIACCGYQTGPEYIMKDHKIPSVQVIPNPFETFLFEKCDIPLSIWGKLYKKDVLQKRVFHANLSIGEDIVFLYQALYTAKKVALTSAKLYFYRQRPKSAMNSGFSQKIIDGNIQSAVLINEYFKNKTLEKKMRDQLNRKISRRIFKYAVLVPKRRDKKNVKKWLTVMLPILKKLKNDGIYRPQFLSLKLRVYSWWLLRK